MATPVGMRHIGTTGSLRMAFMRSAHRRDSTTRDSVGWAKRQRAHHFVHACGQMVGTLALCPPYEFANIQGRRDSIESEFRYCRIQSEPAIGDAESADLSGLPRHIDERRDTFHRRNNRPFRLCAPRILFRTKQFRSATRLLSAYDLQQIASGASRKCLREFHNRSSIYGRYGIANAR
jgi:hypothetical protein